MRDLDRAAAEALDRGQLRLGRVVGHDDRAGNLELPRGPGDALGHVPGARGDDAGLQLLGRDLEDGVQRAAELERADRLEVLELEVDLARVLEAHERRARDAAGQPLPRGPDLGERDQNGTEVPAPSASARA